MKNTFLLSLRLIPALFSIVLLSSCREDFEPRLSSGNLEFSRDTVYLDTVFSTIGSSTYSLKVFNRSNDLIAIPRVGLAQGENSKYRLNVDGLAGKTFENVEIRAKDSIFIFIEATIDLDQDQNALLYTDQLQFESPGNTQEVALVTLVQDAIFLFPSRNASGIKETLEIGTDASGNPISVEGFLLEEEQLRFTNEKPYVIYGYAGVPSGKTMQVEAGARLHFHENSGIIVANEAHLQAHGLLSEDQQVLEREIIFEGDRLEPEYGNVPGQWNTIWFTPGSTGSLQHTTIKNSQIGILADGNSGNTNHDLELKNVQIYNSSAVGLYAVNAAVAGENLVVGNSGISNLWLRQGGNYSFTHSTFANYWDQSFRNTPAVQIDNFLETEDELFVADLEAATFINCIIYGSASRELALTSVASATFNFQFQNTLIRFEDTFGDFEGRPNYAFENESLYQDVLLNSIPDFRNIARNDYRIGEGSAAQTLGNTTGSTQVPVDLLGVARPERSDAGSYQAIQFEN